MVAIAMGLIWGGYTLGMWGYTRISGYQITLTQLVKPGAYTGSWPPPLYPATASATGGTSGSQDPGTSGGFTTKGGNPGSIFQAPQM